jgi:hypothetical protein
LFRSTRQAIWHRSRTSQNNKLRSSQTSCSSAMHSTHPPSAISYAPSRAAAPSQA